MPGSGGYSMKRVLARHISVLLAIPTTNWNWSLVPFLGASLDNIQQCQCSDGCPNKVVEYKCPWKHRDLHPKDAFLTPEIGGIKNGEDFALKPSSKYYFQLQLQMFVSELTFNILVVWTKKESSLLRCLTTQASCLMYAQSWKSFGTVRSSLLWRLKFPGQYFQVIV